MHNRITTIRFKRYVPEYEEVEVDIGDGVSLRYLDLVTWDDQKTIAVYHEGFWIREEDGSKWTDIDLSIE